MKLKNNNKIQSCFIGSKLIYPYVSKFFYCSLTNSFVKIVNSFVYVHAKYISYINSNIKIKLINPKIDVRKYYCSEGKISG